MNTSTQTGLAALFTGAQSGGALSAGAMATIDINDIGADINNALGISVDDVMVGEVTLVAQLIDDSSSMNHHDQQSGVSNAQLARDGHNLVVRALAGSKQKGSILAMCRYLNGTVLYPYNMVDQVAQMDGQNYRPRGGTPLYDEAVTTLAAVIAKTQDFTDNGITCRSVTLIVSDGADAGSRRSSADDVKRLVDDMNRQECHIVAFMGINDGYTDFKEVAKSMGIQDEWVLTPGNTPSEIRAAFAMFSQSAQRASQSAGASFSQSAMGGFAAP